MDGWLQAHMQALRRYMALGQRNKVVTVLVDTARTCLAVQDAARASTLLLKANTLVDQVRRRLKPQRPGGRRGGWGGGGVHGCFPGQPPILRLLGLQHHRSPHRSVS
jgi:hypothetical protein